MRILAQHITTKQNVNDLNTNDYILIIENSKCKRMWFGNIDSSKWTLSNVLTTDMLCYKIFNYDSVAVGLNVLISNKQMLIYKILDTTSTLLLKKAKTRISMFKLLNEIYIQE